MSDFTDDAAQFAMTVWRKAEGCTLLNFSRAMDYANVVKESLLYTDYDGTDDCLVLITRNGLDEKDEIHEFADELLFEVGKALVPNEGDTSEIRWSWLNSAWHCSLERGDGNALLVKEKDFRGDDRGLRDYLIEKGFSENELDKLRGVIEDRFFRVRLLDDGGIGKNNNENEGEGMSL